MKSKKKVVVITVTVSIIVAFYAWFCCNMVYGTTRGSSMLPSFEDGSRTLIYKTHIVNRGDVAAIMCDGTDGLILKRVIGISGDEIEINSTGLHLNGSLLYESYVNDINWTAGSVEVKVTVPENSVFVLGDNRIISCDSRQLGVFSTDNIVGRVLCKDNLF